MSGRSRQTVNNKNKFKGDKRRSVSLPKKDISSFLSRVYIRHVVFFLFSQFLTILPLMLGRHSDADTRSYMGGSARVNLFCFVKSRGLVPEIAGGRRPLTTPRG
jgi:hypothetical protein